MTIHIRTKNVPLVKPLRVDDQGWDCFSLDESKHDVIDIMERTIEKVDAAGGMPVDTRASDARYAQVMYERAKREREAKNERR